MTPTLDPARLAECERVTCTREEPAKNDGRRYVHPEAIDDGECSEGCCEYYRCPLCGIRFKCEVPQ